MSENFAAPSFGTPRMETLESRVLLNGDGLSLAADPSEVLAALGTSIVQPALEVESNGGAANDDIAGAQALDFRYLLPAISADDGFGPQQASVIGTADGSGGMGYAESLTRAYLVTSSAALPTIHFGEATAPGGAGLLKIAARGNLGLASQWLSLEAEGIPLGELFVLDGLMQQEVTAQVSLTQAQLSKLAADGVISFTVTPTVAMAVSGLVLTMDLSYGGGGGTDDFYRLDLAAGESASLSLARLGTGDLALDLYDAAGNVVATGEGADNAAAAIARFVSEEGGTFYACVAGSGDYNLIVNRNAATDLEGNNDIDSAQQLDGGEVNGRRWAIGQVGANGDRDLYAVDLAPCALLNARAYAPQLPAGTNGLLPHLRLYDADGNTVATGSGSHLRFRSTSRSEGTYYLEITGAEETQGDYVLSVKSQAPKAKAPKAKAHLKRAGKGLGDKPEKGGRKKASSGTADKKAAAPKAKKALPTAPSGAEGSAATVTPTGAKSGRYTWKCRSVSLLASLAVLSDMEL